jgi:hypothetical protein
MIILAHEVRVTEASLRPGCSIGVGRRPAPAGRFRAVPISGGGPLSVGDYLYAIHRYDSGVVGENPDPDRSGAAGAAGAAVASP